MNEYFSGLIFITAKVVFIADKIAFIFTFSSAILRYGFCMLY